MCVLQKGFPAGTEADKKEYFELQEEIQQFFSEFGVVNSVRMRNTDEKPHKFKVGSERYALIAAHSR